jgi:transcriptional regulator with XRE-family HTH domain
MTKKIGFKIKKLREAAQLSQEAMAEELGISQGTLCRIENGTVEKVDFEIMNKVCEFFKIDLQYLLDDSCYQSIHNSTAMLMFGNHVVNNYFPEDIMKTILTNQNQITLLLESQNKLIERLLENG